MTVREQVPLRAAPSRRPTHAVGLLVWALALVAWVGVVGLPKQPFLVVGWAWLAVVAYDVRRPWRYHLEFLRDWSPFLVLLLLYMWSRGLADNLGIGVHVTEPVDVDRWLFGGTLPTEYLQAHLCGVPCERSMPPRWYDVGLTTVYYSHFFVTLCVAVWLWLRDRASWLGYVRRYLSLFVVALVGYVLYPMAPPWMAARDGVISPDVARITGRGWFDLGHHGVTGQQRLSAVGNQVAAMPSLHAALALFVAVYAVTRLRSPWRWLLLLYPAAMAFLLVYYAEHYVLDILAGWAVVAVVMWGWARWDRRSST
ncbi:phosphatase PAP2 family protein [Marmoricola sp. RAF53]|uniref:phosphatase PAP2 family protein n=1 Tax=Marmoricola sp. RAF53 TaxID=3233059 RepID=UPI003F993575